jgi:hypothetical protein
MKMAQNNQVEVDSKPFATFMPNTLATVASGRKIAAKMLSRCEAVVCCWAKSA